MKKYTYLLLGIAFLLGSCKGDQIKRDAGETNVWKNGEHWNCKANTTYKKEKENQFRLTLYNTLEENPPPWGNLYFWNLPLEIYKGSLLEFSPTEPYPAASYSHEVLNETTTLGYSHLWEDYPDTHFEITHVSKNQRRVEGFFKLAFIVDDPATTKLSNELDTNYFEGNFEVRVKK